MPGGRKLQPVVHADTQTMSARRKGAEIGDVRRDEAVVCGKFLFVNPDPALPVRAFQKQREMFSVPLARNFKITLIPREAEVMLRRLREKWHLDMTRLRKMLAQTRRLDFPPRVAEREHPRRVRGNAIAVTLRLQNAGQLDFVRQIFGEPVFIGANVVAVERESPLASERQNFGGGQ